VFCHAVLLGGCHPFADGSEVQVRQKILKGEYVMNRHVWRHVSEDAKVRKRRRIRG
jgi:hypothetical protein